MYDLHFLKRTELSYILNNKAEFDHEFIAQVEDYCQWAGLQKDKIKANKAEWDVSSWLTVDIQSNCMMIYKEKDSRKADVNKNLFLLVFMIVAFLCLVVWGFRVVVYDFEFFLIMLTSLPFSIVASIGLMYQRKGLIEKSKQVRKITISNSSKVEFSIDNALKVEGELKAIIFFCTEKEDNGSIPLTSLELKLRGGNVLEVDSGGNYLELLMRGNDIAKFTNKKLNVFKGSSSVKDKIEL